MGLLVRLCLTIIFMVLVCDGDLPWNHRIDRHHHSYPRDWDTDWKLWARSQGWRRGDPVPDYDYTKALIRRQLPTAQDTGTMWVTRQRGSAVIPHRGATVRISPHKQPPQMLYKENVRSMVTDWAKRKGSDDQRLRYKDTNQDLHWDYIQDQSLTTHPQTRPCVRCPGEQTVLAPKGSTSAVMVSPLIIPCHPWTPIDNVKSEVLVGPQPGTKMVQGSHKVVLRLFQHKYTLATCVIRYNVIVRKCPELDLSKGIKADCPLGKAWGSNCTFSCEPGYLLEGDSSTQCSDDLEWTGVQAQCILSTDCSVPIGSGHGHLSCRTPQHRPVSLQGESMLPHGTVCHFRCPPGYVVPPEQSHLTRMRCIAGSWDSDQDPVCTETNELIEEYDIFSDITVDDATRLDGKDCPANFCLNGGKCLTILGEPMCSCQPGYSGPQCEDEDSETGHNTLTLKDVNSQL